MMARTSAQRGPLRVVRHTDDPAERTQPTTPSEEILRLVRQGAPGAREAFCARYLGPLRRWASGRLPPSIRAGGDTDDLVQDTLIRALGQVSSFEYRGPGAVVSYLRQAVKNAICDAVRRAQRRGPHVALREADPDPNDGPLQQVLGLELIERYERALSELDEDDRGLIIARVEHDLGYAQIAEEYGRPSAEAARKAVSRALLRLAERLRDDG